MSAFTRFYALSSYHIKPGLNNPNYPESVSGNGVYYSDDVGRNWQPVDPNYELLPTGHRFPFSDIYADDDHLYISYENIDINDPASEFSVIYKLPHSLDDVQFINSPIVSNLHKLPDNRWLGTTRGRLYVTDADFSAPQLRLELQNTIYSVAIAGDYIAVLANRIYESADGGYSFSQHNASFCQSGTALEAIVAQGQLYVGTFCGVYVKPATINSESNYKQLPTLDFYSRYTRGLYYDEIANDIYVLDNRIHRFNLQTFQLQTLTPAPALAHITDLIKFNNTLYAATLGSGIYRYENGRWHPTNRGLQIHQNSHATNTLSGSEVFRLQQIMSDGQPILCTGTTLGLHCLNTERNEWVDVLSPILTMMTINNIEYELYRQTATLTLHQLDNTRLLLMRDANTQLVIDPTPIASLVNSSTAAELSTISIIDRPSFNPLNRLQKTHIYQHQNQLYLAEGGLGLIGLYNSYQRSFTTGLYALGDVNQFNFGRNYASGTALHQTFLTTNVQQLIEFGQDVVAAVYDGGVYFSSDRQNWTVRNKFLGSLKVLSLVEHQNVLYAGTELGLYRWLEQPQEWQLLAGSEGFQVTTMLSEGDTLWLGTARHGVISFGPAPPHYLTIMFNGNGSGTVTDAGVGLNCSANCDISYTATASLLLTATAEQGSVFAGWEAPCEQASSTCSLQGNQNHVVTASFMLKQYPVELSSSEGGTVVALDNNLINHGSTFTVQVTPKPGFKVLRKVEGTCAPGQWLNSNTYETGVVNSSCTINFTFVPKTPRRAPWWYLIESN